MGSRKGREGRGLNGRRRCWALARRHKLSYGARRATSTRSHRAIVCKDQAQAGSQSVSSRGSGRGHLIGRVLRRRLGRRGLLVALAHGLYRLDLSRDRHELEALALVDAALGVVLNDGRRKVPVELLEEQAVGLEGRAAARSGKSAVCARPTLRGARSAAHLTPLLVAQINKGLVFRVNGEKEERVDCEA